MKNVVMLSTVHPWNDGRIFEKEALTLSGAGWQVVLMAPGARGEGGPVRLIPLRVPQNRMLRMAVGPARALVSALALPGEVYHLHDPELIPVGLVLKAAGRQVVWDTHEDLPLQILGKGWIPEGLRPAVSALARAGEEWAAARFDLCIGATERISERLRAAGARAVTVENLPLPGRFPQAASGEPDGLVYVGGIGVARGAQVMLEAARRCGMALHLAGPIESGERASLIKSPGWGRAVYHGVLGREETARLLSRRRIGLAVLQPLPAYREALPVKVLEYMAAGLPAVISGFPLWRERFEPWHCVLFADPRSPEDVARKVRWLAEHPEEAKSMGHRGREAVRKHLSWNGEAAKLLGAYAALDKAPDFAAEQRKRKVGFLV